MTRNGKSRLTAFLAMVLLCVSVAGCYMGMRAYYRTVYPKKFTEYVEQYAAEYKVDPAFLYALIKTESDFQPNAVSVDDACGLMQLLPSTLSWLQNLTPEDDRYAREDLFEPEVNVRYGTYFVGMLFERFHEPEVVAAAYHAGINGVAGWLKDPAYSKDGVHLDVIPYEDTRLYVSRIRQYYVIYSNLYKT